MAPDQRGRAQTAERAATGELVCPVCARLVTTLVHCLCGWRSCRACQFDHPHYR